MGAAAGNGAPGASQGFDGGLDHSTLVIAGVIRLGLTMAVLDTTMVVIGMADRPTPRPARIESET
jgi:hypothetical protein